MTLTRPRSPLSPLSARIGLRGAAVLWTLAGCTPDDPSTGDFFAQFPSQDQATSIYVVDPLVHDSAAAAAARTSPSSRPG